MKALSLHTNHLHPSKPAAPPHRGWIIGGIAAICLLGSADFAEAARLDSRDLRYLRYSGAYRGFSEGTVRTWNGNGYDVSYVDERSREVVPVRSRVIVTAPTGNNGFFLTHRSTSGSSRRVTIRTTYSGVSYNSAYGEDMVGSGSKTLSIVKRGYSRPRFDMRVADNLNERAASDGGLFSTWRIRGFLSKG